MKLTEEQCKERFDRAVRLEILSTNDIDYSLSKKFMLNLHAYVLNLMKRDGKSFEDALEMSQGMVVAEFMDPARENDVVDMLTIVNQFIDKYPAEIQRYKEEVMKIV